VAAIPAQRTAPAQRRGPTFAQRQALGGYLLLLPVLLVLLGLVAYPFLFAIAIAFTDRLVGQEGSFVGFDNFRYLAGQSSFQRAVTNTVIMVVVTGVLKFVIGLGLALLLNERMRGQRVFRSLVLLPWAMPGFVAFLVWRLLFQPIGGGINLVLTEIGLLNGVIDWLGQRSTALPAVIVASVWRGFPFWCISFLAALQSVPAELYEAAKIDGASAWQRFTAVTMPAIRPVVLTVVLLSSIWTANSFENVWIMTQGGPSDATMVFPVLAYFGMQTQRLGEAAAVSVALVPALLILVVIVTALMRDEE
jgi:ABC-type sugar transport system permease subunit